MNPDVSGLFVGQILRLRLRVPPELVEGMTRDEGLFGQALRCSSKITTPAETQLWPRGIAAVQFSFKVVPGAPGLVSMLVIEA